MKFYVMTLFPQMVMDALNTSITGRATAKGIFSVEAVDIREYTKDKHCKTDDYPYGGGAGMVMQVQPVYDCYKAIEAKICEDGLAANDGDVMANTAAKKPRVLYMSPQGRVFDQSFAKELAQEENLVFLCGHYEGIDERALELLEVEEVSLGDFILTGGELPAITMIDCISRLIPGVLGSGDSAEIESFHDNLLEYPQYSRPEEFMGLKVPDVLLSGHHANVDKWRREQSIIRTLQKRPDLIEGAVLNKKEKKFLDKLLKELAEREMSETEAFTEKMDTGAEQ